MPTAKLMSNDTLHELAPYLENNQPLPQPLLSDLTRLLIRLSRSLLDLKAEIGLLERLVDVSFVFHRRLSTARILKEQHEATLQKYSVLQSRVRCVPPELLGIIFRMVLGSHIFDADQRQKFLNLSNVCPLWRRTIWSTPDLCRGLVVNTDRWLERELGDSLVKEFTEDVGPWMSLGKFSKDFTIGMPKPKHKKGLDELVSTLLNAFQVPFDTLIIEGDEVLAAILASGSQYPNMERLYFYEQLTVEPVPLCDERLLGLHTAFPSLLYLKFDDNIEVTYDPPLQLSNLLTLNISTIYSDRGKLSTFLLSLPVLEELAISSQKVVDDPKDDAVWTHPSLKRLIMNDEYTLYQLLYARFPSLEYFAVRGTMDWDSDEECEPLAECMFNVIQLSQPRGLTLDLAVMDMFLEYLAPRLSYVERLVLRRNISPTARIDIGSDSLKEVILTKKSNAGNLSWLVGGPGDRSDLGPLRLLFPSTMGSRTRVDGSKFLEWGIMLEYHSPAAIHCMATCHNLLFDNYER